MKSLERYLVRTHPVTKILLYLQLLSVAIWGPLISSVVVTITCFIFLVFYPGEKGIIANPFYAMLFCTIAVLIVIPTGSKDEIIYASELSARIFNIMLISAILGLVIKPYDILIMGRLLHTPGNLVTVIITTALFFPIAMQNIYSVIFAQRSRGLELSFSSLFRLMTYRAITIPYVVCILRSALAMWISINLRPWSKYKLAKAKVDTLGLILFLASFALWLDYSTLFALQ